MGICYPTKNTNVKDKPNKVDESLYEFEEFSKTKQ